MLGEITAYRCWDISQGVYQSLNGTLWVPDEPMSGAGIEMDNSSGVYAFKTYAEAKKNAKHQGNLAIGSVKMWGRIVEHENGYRAEFAKIDQIMDGAISEYHRALRQKIQIEQECGPYFEEAHRKDKSSYSFRCERYGDFLSVFIERYGQKMASAVALNGIGAITPREGCAVTVGNVPFHLYKSSKDFHLSRYDQQMPGRMLHVPQPTSQAGASGFGWAGGRGITVPNCPSPARDDEIHFGNGGVILYVPHGLGQEVFQKILNATRQAA